MPFAKDKKNKITSTITDQPTLKILGIGEAGFPVPQSDYHDDDMNLDEYLVRDKDASYMIKVKSTGLLPLGVKPKDILILERGLDPKTGDIVLAISDDGDARLKIFSENIANTDRIDGVVVSLIRKYR